ncbi:hypothetical protein [Streptomyces guryensis]|uniref:Lipoprotein n=1 Tax=Streptomyces guryensis TaxID=2886947 RepID=A0A9Q3VWB0_9ACTN|nr:hypothetical protein [Streptomyces guryensis]MCD9879744.1 hypothetical protein [Streptomyces guryensis]
MRLRRHLLPCVALVACLAGCGAVDGGVQVEGPPVTPKPWSGPVYMTDWFGRSWLHPKEVAPTGRIYLDRLTWRDWGSARPRATGVASDTTCLSGCPNGDPPSYRVKVVLSGLVKRGDVAYYSHVRLIPLHPPAPFWAYGQDSADLEVPDA